MSKAGEKPIAATIRHAACSVVLLTCSAGASSIAESASVRASKSSTLVSVMEKRSTSSAITEAPRKRL
ncbi:hypothetical protein D3C83_212420 [compost metagenome]